MSLKKYNYAVKQDVERNVSIEIITLIVWFGRYENMAHLEQDTVVASVQNL